MRGAGGKGREGEEKEGERDWVSSDCVSGQLHMFLIKFLTLQDQLHTGLLVFVTRPIALWSGQNQNTGPDQDHLLTSPLIKPLQNYSPTDVMYLCHYILDIYKFGVRINIM